MMRRPIVVTVAAVALIAVAVGVIASNGNEHADAKPSEVDVGFAQDMIVHHQQAVLMAAYTREHGGSDAVRALASAIDEAQQREIGQMTGWLQSWGAPIQSDRLPMSWMSEEHMPGHMHDDAGPDSMPGMASPAEMDRLVNLTGKRLDAQFLRLMTRHHEGGLPMAKDAATRAGTPYVREAARAMIRDQQREIDQMQLFLQQAAGSAQR